MLIVRNQRSFKHNESVAGVCTIENKILGVIVEDIPREKKIPKITGIPAGEYFLGIRKELTPLTIAHRNSANYRGWFEYHIEVLNVPNFTGIYFHIGNDSKNTDGCQCGGKRLGFANNELYAYESTMFNKEFYGIVYPLLLKGETVKYIITNEF